jgi:AsmA family protein
LFGGGEETAEPYPVRLAIGPETARLIVDGHVARPFALAGLDFRVDAEGGDLAPLLAAIAVPVAATPPFDFEARLTDAGGGWALRDVAARIGESRINGGASVLLAGRPKPLLKFDASAPRIVPADFGWLASIGGLGNAPSGRWASAELPTAWLRVADAEGELRVDRLEGLAAEPAGLRAAVELKDGRLRLQPLRLELAGGAAEGSATVEADAAGDGSPRAGLRLEADDLRLGPLMAAFGVGGDVAGAVRTASVDVSGRGRTPREMAADLDGAARFRIADGSLRVPGLAQLSMGLVETFGAVLGVGEDAGATPVACAIGDLPVREGVVHAERLAMVTPRVAINGEGTVRLGEGTMHLVLTPSPLDEALLQVVVPVVISGQLASPEVSTRPALRVGMRPESAADVCAEEGGGR